MKTYKYSDVNKEITSEVIRLAIRIIQKYDGAVDEEGGESHITALTDALIDIGLFNAIFYLKAGGAPTDKIIETTFKLGEQAAADTLEKMLAVNIQVSSHVEKKDFKQYDKGVGNKAAAAAVADILKNMRH